MPSWDRLPRYPAFLIVTFVSQGAAPHDLATVEVAPEYRATILEFLVRAMKAEKLRGHCCRNCIICSIVASCSRAWQSFVVLQCSSRDLFQALLRVDAVPRLGEKALRQLLSRPRRFAFGAVLFGKDSFIRLSCAARGKCLEN